ncbi:MAG: sulfatase-like hydrolase/transferase [Endomicrobium sp.]|jgi:phosphoglycerol transferase MdoB-like AlkP superfamily enzyme|nr:sulfatase-like hydrolase/transferase [Endomicrobium sp.]
MNKIFNLVKSVLLKKYPQDIKTKIKISLFYFVSLVLVFALFRFLICIVYCDVFASLSAYDKAISFLYGLRFDLSIINLLLGGFIILLFFPYRANMAFIKVCAALMSFSYLIMLLALSADFFYFPEVKRHMTEELFLAWRDKDFILRYVLSYYWWVLIAIFALIFIVVNRVFAFINKNFAAKPLSLLKSILIFISVILLVVIGRRENFSGMPLNLIDAYNLPKSPENIQLILNGAFTQYYYLKGTNDSKGVIENKYPSNEAIKNTREFLLSKNEIFPDDKYPVMRRINAVQKMQNYNIIVVLLESWTPRYIDSLNGNKGYDVTPNFDKIVEEGIVFTNAYAAGPRSQFGLIASLAGRQIVPGTVHYYGFDMMNKFMAIAQPFNKRGYYTMYAQATPRNSIMMCNVAENFLGFNESYGMEDFPQKLNYSGRNSFGYDYDMLDFVSNKAGQKHKSGQPFFIYAFTGSTHAPFYEISDEFKKYPHNRSTNGYLNNLYYADYSISHLLKKAKEDGYFDNTIFIFMADHVIKLPGYDMKLDENFKIPFVIYAPDIFKPQKINYTVSQSDLIPTLYHLMGFDDNFSAIGTNMLDKDANHFALICHGSNIAFIKDGEYMIHNRINIVDSSFGKDGQKSKAMLDILLSLDKTITESIKNNRWYE